MGHHSFTEVDHLWTFERRAEMPDAVEIAEIAEVHEIAESGESRESGAQTAAPPTIHISTACASIAQCVSGVL